jgi:hypothetical protein
VPVLADEDASAASGSVVSASIVPAGEMSASRAYPLTRTTGRTGLPGRARYTAVPRRPPTAAATVSSSAIASPASRPAWIPAGRARPSANGWTRQTPLPARLSSNHQTRPPDGSIAQVTVPCGRAVSWRRTPRATSQAKISHRPSASPMYTARSGASSA